jgi:hypothetical protein
MKSVTCSVLALAGLLLAGLGGERLGALLRAQEDKKVVWKYGLSFQVRKAGQDSFDDKESPKYGAEIFDDRDVKRLVYVTETAALSLGAPDKLKDGPDVERPRLYHALEVRVRAAGQDKFDDKVKKYGSEVFRDPNSDNLVYICETGSVAVIPAAGISAPDKIKDPAWFHGLELKVRKAGEDKFGDRTKKVGLEVYKDENTNHLFYITDSGYIAVVPARDATKPSEVKGPTWYHAFELPVRKGDEKEFTEDTRAYGVEVYKDENANNLIYISDSGAIAVVPAGGVTKPEGSKKPARLHGRSFRVRKADEPDFNDKTQKFGAEVYRDENTGNLVIISESGALAVLPK